jgi:glycosyltransferase involved in cell wall biosynthesis
MATDSPERRIRPLLIAKLCNPDWVSVPLEGWFHSRAISTLTDAHLVTDVSNRENILKAGLVEGVDFTAIDTARAEARVEKLSPMFGAGYASGRGWTTRTALSTLSYYSFERLVWRRFEDRIKSGAFDLVHRLTPLSPTTPSPIATRCAGAGVPFVLGPLNGGLPWPPGFGGVRIREREWLSWVRGMYRLVPGYRATRQHAAALVMGSRASLEELDPASAAKAVYVPENGIDPGRFDTPASEPVALPLRVAFVGRLVPYKGADILIEAAAPLARAGRVMIEVMGDGPEMSSLRAVARHEGVSSVVEFAGWVDHKRLKERLGRCHVFGFPSVREFGGAVVLEAMALGIVPIVMDYGGPGELVSPATGFALPMASRAEIVAALRATLERLTRDPSRIRPMGERARVRALGRFAWSAKAEQVLEVYRWVLGRRERPDFGMPLPDPS